MRFLAFIFSVYFLWLTVQPCSDHDSCEGTVAKTGISSEQNPCNHPAGEEFCSPFCTCSCCSTHIIVTHFQHSTLPFERTEKSFTNIPQSHAKEIYFSIWQPPKLS